LVGSWLVACAAIGATHYIYKKSRKNADDLESTAFIFDSVPMVLTLWDANRNVIDCNQEAVRRYGLQDKEQYRTRLHDIMPDTQPAGYMAMTRCFKMLSNAHDGEQLILNVMHYNTQGEEIPMEVSFFNTTYRGKPAVLTCATDIGGMYESMAVLTKERERNLAVEANSQAKSRFLARMSHEIRTPITAVLGIAEIILQRQNLNAELEEAITKIYNSSYSLIGIINDILDLSKIEAGKMNLLDEKYETTGLISDVVQMCLVLLGSKQCNFVVRVDEALPAYLQGDELRVKQVLVNVLSNAIKYTETGEVKFNVECRPDLSSGDYVNIVITVTDTGRGMTPEQLNALFKEYSRFHEVEDRFTEGTGLGMPIVFSLLQLMSATIDVKSNVGEGTRVVLTIPQRITERGTIGAQTAKRLEQFEAQSSARS
ncbi:MAG: PAS domain-containing sensor histidine kinase, partial [Defluviitaleaceae bacterium]|nr:PAS domain-containing sensor histidine kinase [Defluviitaleaceae bacterium]